MPKAMECLREGGLGVGAGWFKMSPCLAHGTEAGPGFRCLNGSCT